MTNSEAIEHGKEQLEIFGGRHAEFIRMAIEALSAQSEYPLLKIVQDFKEATGCNDILVVQKDAIKAWDENGVEYTMQPERTGEWRKLEITTIDNQNGMLIEFKCDQCNEVQLTKSHFCPNCGADMRQNKEEK